MGVMPLWPSTPKINGLRCVFLNLQERILSTFIGGHVFYISIIKCNGER